MKNLGLPLPVTNMFATTLSAGPSTPPYYLKGAIGPSFLTPETAAFNATRKKYGSMDDPDAGGYCLAQIDWDKDNGQAEMSQLEATNSGWYAAAPAACNCTSSTCGCH